MPVGVVYSIIISWMGRGQRQSHRMNITNGHDDGLKETIIESNIFESAGTFYEYSKV